MGKPYCLADLLPVLSTRIQEFYGVSSKFTLGHGRVPVKIEVLAPNQRPIPVTDDLSNFWRGQYSIPRSSSRSPLATPNINGDNCANHLCQGLRGRSSSYGGQDGGQANGDGGQPFCQDCSGSEPVGGALILCVSGCLLGSTDMKRIEIALVLIISVLNSVARAQSAPLPPAAQEALRKGTLAAGQKHWAVALRCFGEARAAAPDAPQPLFNLGLAEAQLPGRELRAIAWFHAYLVLAPDAPNAATVREQIAALDIVAEGRVRQIFSRLKQFSAQLRDYRGEASDAGVKIAALTARMAAPAPAPFALPADMTFTAAQRAGAWAGFVERELAAPLFTDFQTTLAGVAVVSASADSRAWTVFSATRSMADTYIARLTDLRCAWPETDLVAGIPIVTNYAKRSGFTLMPIAPGEFMMGRASGGYGEERPQTHVTISRLFFLGATEVTQAQWRSVMGSDPSQYKGDTLPVESVSWNEAMAFCKKLTERERAAGRLPVGWEFTLPTEAQWEYACRAGTTGDYAGDLDAMAWYDKNVGENKTHAVGTKQSNAWGLYDMHGNVYEYCLDWFDYYHGGSETDPTGPASGDKRVGRGGCGYLTAEHCRSTYRTFFSPTSGNSLNGFRLALAPSH